LKIETKRDGDIAVLLLANPPVNALSISAGLVRELGEALAQAVADPTVRAIVIAGAGRMFSGGADINDFGGDSALLDTVRTLMSDVEASPKPVVAAIHGTALGGGLELALAAHYRLADRKARLGLPEVSLGLLPGGGGTQRLPRLVGFAPAIAMMVGGAPVTAQAAEALGLVDELFDGDPVEAALAFVRRSTGLEIRPTDAIVTPDGGAEALAAARAKLDPNALNTAPAVILDCVEQVLRAPIAQGLAYEAAAFGRLTEAPASLGLRHAFFAERAVARIPGLSKDIQPATIAAAAVIGAGTMGRGIATALLNAGLSVVLIETRQTALDQALSAIGDTLRREVEKGRLSAAAMETRLAGLEGSTELAAVGDADLVIEAVYEDMAVKSEVFQALDRLAKPPAILASNTSFLDIDSLAALTGRPGQVLGLHFFSPANVMRLLEIVRGAKTSPQTLATAVGFARQIGKVGVIAGVCDGFIGNRMLEEYLRQAYFLVEEGATPQQVDAALERWGFAMGPFRMLDLAGQDVAYAVRKRRMAEYPDRPYSTFLDRIVEQGRLGQKTGKGVYDYPDGRKARVDPEIEAMLVDHSRAEGLTRRTIGEDEIVDRCVLALINEGARVLADGIAYRPLDIDVVYLHGYGFPAERGGPMFFADRLGLPEVVTRLRRLSQGRHGWAFQPAPLLSELVARGEAFETPMPVIGVGAAVSSTHH
jgi:3-hydroxyacyl-CoA dehydrogenase